MIVKAIKSKMSGKGKVIYRMNDELTVISQDATHYIVETKTKQRHTIRKEDVRVITQ